MVRFPVGNECQCGSCGQFFSSPSGLDWHHWWRGRGDAATLHCLDPAEIGLVVAERRNGPTWSFPPDKPMPSDLRRRVIENLGTKPAQLDLGSLEGSAGRESEVPA